MLFSFCKSGGQLDMTINGFQNGKSHKFSVYFCFVRCLRRCFLTNVLQKPSNLGRYDIKGEKNGVFSSGFSHFCLEGPDPLHFSLIK